MSEPLFPLAYLRDARLASLATSPAPTWLWQADGRRVLWANGAAAAVQGVASAAAVTARRADEPDAVGAEIAQLAQTLPETGSPRLTTLAPLGASGRKLTALCSRLLLDDDTPAVLVIATEPTGPRMPLQQRVAMLIGEAPIAAFSPDGALIHATAAATSQIGPRTTLAALGAEALGAAALASGHATGRTPAGHLHFDRVGRDANVALIATFTSSPSLPVEAVSPMAESGAPAAQDATPEPTAPVAEHSEHPPMHRPPLRFVWEMDQDGRFTINSDEFIDLIGPRNAALLGRPWVDIAAALDLDPQDQFSSAVESRETWSGVTLQWPVEGRDERLPVEMSGLPTFDRERHYRGYRGFAVCRDAQPAQTPESGTADAPGAAPPTLSPGERTAFRELARQLSARLKGERPEAAAPPEPPAATTSDAAEATEERAAAEPASDAGARAILDRLPVGVLIYRSETPLYANRAFLRWSGDDTLDAFAAGGGLDRLLRESRLVTNGDGASPATPTGAANAAESRLVAVEWNGEPSHALIVVPLSAQHIGDKAALARAQAALSERDTILAAVTEGAVILDADGRIEQLDLQAERLFSRQPNAVAGRSFLDLLAPESRAVAAADFDAFVAEADAHHRGREVMVRIADGESRALSMTFCRLGNEMPRRYCAAFGDIGRWTREQQALIEAKRQAEDASRAKSAFIAKLSHEIRTPLTAIIGFAEVMMEERLGPIDNERYRAYLKDIHSAGAQLMALLNDLVDLSKIETGNIELTFDEVDLNALTRECVAMMQQQANRGRIIIRMSLTPRLSPIVADARSVCQILLNLLSNSIKFTGAGGQVIVSTTASDHGEAILRVRDTGVGMSEQEVESALEPFRQVETSVAGGSGGIGLGLPLTKALAAANRANFAIKSGVNAGTLVEVAFPTAPARGG